METEETQVRPEDELLEKAEQTEEAVLESPLEIRIAKKKKPSLVMKLGPFVFTPDPILQYADQRQR